MRERKVWLQSEKKKVNGEDYVRELKKYQYISTIVFIKTVVVSLKSKTVFQKSPS